MMRVGLVSYEYPPQQGLGGVGTYMFRLAGALGKAGHEVHVIAGPADPRIADGKTQVAGQTNVTVHRVPAEFRPRFRSRALRWLYWRGVAGPMSRWNPMIWHWIKWDLGSLEAIERVDATFPLDVVEAPEHAANGWMAGRLHRWPIVLRLHCPWETFVRVNRLPLDPMNRLMSMLERWTVARYADCLTVPSRAMRMEVEKSWRLRRPARVIPNFMDVPAAPAPLPEEPGAQRIVCAGRIEPLKGQDTLARAFAKVAQRHPRAELWLIGPDRWPGRRSFRDLLPRLVADAGIRARIHLPGLVPLEVMQEHLLGARVAVVSSIGFESFSFSALEAMAAARPTVVTRTGALPELIGHEREGLVVGPGNAVELAAAIGRFLEDRELSERCALAAHGKALLHYDTRRVLPRMLEAYEEAGEFFRAEGGKKARGRGQRESGRGMRASLEEAGAAVLS